MTTLLTICGLGLISVISIAVIKELYPNYAKWIVLSFALLCIVIVLPGITDSVNFLKQISSITESKYTGLIFRALGIAYLSGAANNICNSAGGESIGAYIEMVGRVEIIILSLPLFQELLDMVLI